MISALGPYLRSAGLSDAPGFPMSSTSFDDDGGVLEQSTVLSIESPTLDDSWFAMPAD